ncbi:hypothetical protein Bca52824_006025 [Brassica carinata]|uniref:Uncharacterized protein n=1 Tax=Brassica carinata TaxID=52824 RepID=A0A8X7WT90_BRACI|nr:hypothetical protein Bca52824_006025 [Brassica carinata]
MEVVSPIPSSASQRRLKFSKSYFQALGVTGVAFGETTITRLVPSNSNSNLEIVKTEPKEFVAHSVAVNCLKIRRKSSRVLVTDSVTFDASEVLVTAGAASQNNEGETQIKGCGGMARKICFLRLNVKGWSSFKEFIDKEVYKDLADVEVKLSELEAELSETNVVKCT